MTAATKLNNAGSTDPKPGPYREQSKGGFSVGSVVKKLITFILVLITFALYSVLVPLFLIFNIPLYIYRGIVMILQKILKPDWIGIMSSRDALVGLDDTTKRCECMIVASIVFKGDPDIKKCQEYFQKHVIEAKGSRGQRLYEKMSFYYENWLGFAFWKRDENFKIENHVRLFDYDIKSKSIDGKRYVTEDELLRTFTNIEALPFPKGRSPWEIMILPNYIPREGDLHRDYTLPEITQNDGQNKEEKYFSLVYRVHHALADGYSFLKMLMCNICTEPVESCPRAPERKYSFFIRILNYIGVLIFTPYYHFRQFFVDIDRSLWHLPTNKLSKKSHFVTTEKIPMESLRQVGKAYEVPLTGVFLAGLAGGIHNFLKLTGKGNLIPTFMRAFSPMPWQNHPAFATEGMVNHWTAGVFAIPVGEDTPHKRLRACKKSMQDLVNSPILISNFYTIPVLLSAPNLLTDIWGTNWMTSMILSNFPGPKTEAKSFGEYPLDNIITFVPHMRGSAGLGIMYPTTLGNVRCTVSIDTSILKDYSDAQFLVSLIDEEFRILRSLHSPYTDQVV